MLTLPNLDLLNWIILKEKNQIYLYNLLNQASREFDIGEAMQGQDA